MSEQASPLSWPQGWPRARSRSDPKFGEQSIDVATQDVLAELGRLGARRIIISTNLRLRVDGLPYSGQPQPFDAGVAIYFELGGKRTVLACDKWRKIQQNMRAITKHIEALRGQDRWGVGSIERAFAGYAALPAPDDWRQILGYEPGENPHITKVAERFRERAQKAHPDVPGGSHDAMARLNRGYETARKELGR